MTQIGYVVLEVLNVWREWNTLMAHKRMLNGGQRARGKVEGEAPEKQERERGTGREGRTMTTASTKMSA